MDKILYKIAKVFGIKFCNGCGKCVWWSKDTAYWADDPEDRYTAPICEGCRYFFEEKYPY